MHAFYKKLLSKSIVLVRGYVESMRFIVELNNPYICALYHTDLKHKKTVHFMYKNKLILEHKMYGF